MVVEGGAEWRRRRWSRGVGPGRGFTLSSKRHHFKPIAVALLTLVCQTASQEQEGDWCVSEDGSEGICRHLRNCPYLQSQPDVFNGAGADNPHLCSFGESGTIVCCPTVTPKVAATKPVSRPVTPRPPPAPPRTTRPPAARPASRPAAPGGLNTAGMRISERKCHEYMNSVDVEANPLRSGGGLLDDWCPYPPPGNGLIVGGTTANSGEYPHMAALGYLNRQKRVEWLCGGSLISPSYVLTAAHCLSGSLIAVGLGVLQVSTMRMVDLKQRIEEKGENSNIHLIAESLRHPKFSIFSHYDDIALIRLAVPVKKFDSYVRPACLHEGLSMDGIKTAVACGFGHTVHKDASPSRPLKYVTLNIYGLDVCNQVFSAVVNSSKLSKGLLESQTCAGELAGGKDTCDGDSGSPLQMRDSKDKCIVRIIGVTSFGTVLCGSVNTAALYTRVSHYLPWIESVVWSSQ